MPNRRKPSGIRVAIGDSHSLEDHVAWIKGQVDRSLEDGETIQLAGKLVSGRFDFVEDPRTRVVTPVVEAWDHYYRAPQTAICMARDYNCEVLSIWEFLVTNLRYTADQDGVDTFKTLKAALESGAEDCDGFTICFAALLKAIGFRVVARVIATKGSDYWEHIYPMVGMPKDNIQGFLPLDATVPRAEPGWQYPKIGRHRDFWM